MEEKKTFTLEYVSPKGTIDVEFDTADEAIEFLGLLNDGYREIHELFNEWLKTKKMKD